MADCIYRNEHTTAALVNCVELVRLKVESKDRKCATFSKLQLAKRT
jgi:hypothetical protein